MANRIVRAAGATALVTSLAMGIMPSASAGTPFTYAAGASAGRAPTASTVASHLQGAAPGHARITGVRIRRDSTYVYIQIAVVKVIRARSDGTWVAESDAGLQFSTPRTMNLASAQVGTEGPSGTIACGTRVAKVATVNYAANTYDFKIPSVLFGKCGAARGTPITVVADSELWGYQSSSPYQYGVWTSTASSGNYVFRY
ncbi:hypothetical protein Back2_01170 [Nocardioides baekrokdamisoli]|uniref:Tat pathway signal sequence domain protein n=1 Tax=Nocardioides baekrokdamisoli TaxID=1804624 RepID=A0A3G9IAQ8_9ACTN|nr:hypothetical protein [Nocardioides baekrokdamisoli]BBH15830.1 hypothetical protein Back2_01170 [Nocardioides baekrokdamisoli]